MFVGHAALAFALVAGAARFRGAGPRRALVLGAVAGAFATVPDVDIVYALAGLTGLGDAGVWSAVDAFWTTGNVVHRAVTHSLVLGAPAAAGFALLTRRRLAPVGAALLVSLVAWVWLAGGPLAGTIAAASFAVGAAVAVYAARDLALGPTAVLATAAAGLLTHPMGDLFTGEPPALLYPFDVTLVETRVVLHPDPTMHLLAAFVLELATIWLAAAVYVRLRGDDLRSLIDRRAAVGAGYAAVVLVLPAPTLEASYHFVFSVLSVGAVGLVTRRRPPALVDDRLEAAMTGLAAVTLAVTAYAAAYAVP